MAKYTPEQLDALSQQIIGLGFDTPAPVAPTTDQNAGYLGDLGTAAKKSFQTIPGALAGLADIPVAAITGDNYVTQAADYLGAQTGFQPGRWAREASAEYSPDTQAQMAQYEDVEGFLPSLGYLATNPGLAGLYATESLGSMIAGGAIGKGLQGAKLVGSALTGAGIGEGAIMGGQQMQNLMEQGADPRIAAAASATTGVIGGTLGVLGGRAAQKMGLTDIDVLLAGGGRATGTAATAAEGSLARKMASRVGYMTAGGLQEGVLEEAPQSFMESVIANLALGKDPMEGVGKDVATGLAAGTAMGATVNVLGRRSPVDAAPGTTDSGTTTPTPIAPEVLANLGVTPEQAAGYNDVETLAAELLNDKKITSEQYNSVVSEELQVSTDPVEPVFQPIGVDANGKIRYRQYNPDQPEAKVKVPEGMILVGMTESGKPKLRPIASTNAPISAAQGYTTTLNEVFPLGDIQALFDGAAQVSAPTQLAQLLAQPAQTDTAVQESVDAKLRAKARTKRAVERKTGADVQIPQQLTSLSPVPFEANPLRAGVAQANTGLSQAREAELRSLEAKTQIDPAIDALELPLLDKLSIAVGVDATTGETAAVEDRVQRKLDPTKGSAGRTATKTEEQMMAADSSWRTLVSKLEELKAEGVETANLEQILRDAAGLSENDSLYRRGDAPISSRDKIISGKLKTRNNEAKTAAREAAVAQALAEGKSKSAATKAGAAAAKAVPTSTGDAIAKFFADAAAELQRLGATESFAGVDLEQFRKNTEAYQRRLAEIEQARVEVQNTGTLRRNLAGVTSQTIEELAAARATQVGTEVDAETQAQDEVELPSADVAVDIDYETYVDTYNELSEQESFVPDDKPRKTTRWGALPDDSTIDLMEQNGRAYKWQIVKDVQGRIKTLSKTVGLPERLGRPNWLNRIFGRRNTAASFLADKLASGNGVPVDELINGISGILAPSGDPYAKIIDRLLAFGMNNTLVYGMPEAALNRMYNNEGERYRGTINGVFRNRDGVTEIYINEKIFGTQRSLQTLLHEVLHDLTTREIENNPRMRARFEQLMETTKQALLAQGVPQSTIDKTYGFTNVKEFIAESYTNVEFQDMLASVMIEEATGAQQSLWDVFTRFVKQLFGFDVDPEPFTGSALEQALILSDKVMETQRAKREGLEAVNPEYWLGQDIDAQWGFAEGAAPSMVNALNKVFGENTKLSNIGAGFDWFKLGAMRLDQLVRTYKDKLPALVEYDNIARVKNDLVRSIQYSAEQINKQWVDIDPEITRKMSALMVKATALGIHPDLPWVHPKNKHLFKSKKATAKKAQYEQLRKEWIALQEQSPAATKLYKQTEKFFKEQRAAITQAAIEHVARVYKADEAMPDALLAQLKSVKSVADVDALAIDDIYGDQADNLRTSLKSIVRSAAAPGPYFPLRRFGDYVIDASKKRTQAFASREMARRAVKEFQEDADNYGQKAKVLDEQVDGKWVVEITERFFETFESEFAANKALQDYKDDGFGPTDPDQYGTELEVRLKKDAGLEVTGADTLILSRVKNKFKDNPKVQRELETAFVELLADSSIRRAELRRSVVRGESHDMQRAFAERALATSWAVADMTTSLAQENAIKEAEAQANRESVEMQRVIKELRRREGQSVDDRTVSLLDRVASKYGFIMNLFSPSYALVNMTQVPLITMPYLSSKYGATSAMMELWKAYNGMGAEALNEIADKNFGFKGAPDDILDSIITKLLKNETTKDVGNAITRLRSQGIIDATFMQELYETSKGLTDRGALGQAGRFTLDLARFAPQLVEIVNRVVTAKSAFNLEMAKQNKLIDEKIKKRILRGGAIAAAREQANELAYDAAREAVLQTQFDYSDMNKPRLFKGAAGWRTIMMFKMYAQGIYSLLISSALGSFDYKDKSPEGKRKRSEARKMLTGMLASHSMAAGVAGGLLSEPVRLAIAVLGVALGDADDDDDFWSDPDYATRKFIGDLSNEHVAEIVMKGLPRAAGVDLNSRLGLQNLLWMRQQPTETYVEGYKNALVGLLGPVANNIGGHFRSIDYLKKGDVSKAVEASMPKAVRDLLRSYRYYDEGLTSYTGTSIMKPDDMLWHDLMYQAVGFSPANVAEKYEARKVMTQRETQLNARRQQLVENFYKADAADRGRYIREEIIDWNIKHPEFAITTSTLLTSFRNREEDAAGADQNIYSKRYSINEMRKNFNVR